ncbi:hypothetical protein M426DRAFT_317478 [Hypoxylon sp. CI-4A]|nr:hypothetical protein M426DRAFT_317478 [Hypoxylon sp. CI-4A]
MAGETNTSASTSAVDNTTTDRASSLTGNAPPGFGLRRAATVGQPAAPARRRPTLNTGSPSGEQQSFADIRRRSSTYSDYSLNDARRGLETSAGELLNPSKFGSQEVEKSPFSYIPLTLALLPALAGIFFENGSAFFTDLILLSLAAVFLHWSVTQPWDWYRSAQEVRVVRDEIMTRSVFESDSDVEPLSPTTSGETLDNVPKEAQNQSEPNAATSEPPRRLTQKWEEERATALRELYAYEMAALAWCFIFPMLGAYLLHTIRGQLSRPSEGLVSDYNLTIFLCAAEVRPVSHLLKMLQNRTLRVQQIAAQNPYEKQAITMDQFETLTARLEDLESREFSNGAAPKDSVRFAVPEPKQVEVAVAQEFRKTIQPELDALNRAMRRYEKKLTLLANQTDNRIEYTHYRLNDAIALAAVAAKNSNARWSLGGWLVERSIAVVMLPVQTVVSVFTFPFRTVSRLLSRKSKSATLERTQRSGRNGKALAQGRSSDRVPARVSKR